MLGFGLLLRLLQLLADRGLFLFLQVNCGELPEGRRDDVGIPALKEHQIAGNLAAGVLFQRKVNAVLLGGGGKGTDVLIGDLDVGNASVVLHKLPEGLLAVVQLGLVAGHSFLHLVQHFFHGLLQHPGGELGSLHTEGNGALGDFFLHKSSSPFSAAVQVVVHQGSVVAVDGGRGVIQGSQKIFLDVADIGGVLPHTVQHILDVGTVQLQEPGFHHLCRIVVPGNADRLPAGTNGIHHKLHQLVQTVTVDEVGDVSLVNLRHIPLDNIGNAFLKRAVDIVGSLLLIVCTSPIMLFAAIGVKLSSPGPILFKQERVGLNKKPFYMYKFRSMRVNDKQNTGWSTNSDPRKTKFGSFIRKFSIDELPQFFNVLMGDMSLVGPRPELPYFVNQFKESVPLYMVKHQVRPGITGWAQVNGFRGDTSIQGRIEHDIYYIENWTLLFDIKILFMTVFKFSNSETIVK